MWNLKAIAAVLGAAIVVGGGVYLIQQRQIEGLRARNQALVAQQQELSAELDAAKYAAQRAQAQSAGLQQDNADLLRLRNEVGQLRRERDAARQRASQPAATPPAGARVAVDAGRYISKDQLTFAGYATPEAALESTTWVLINGTYEQALASLGPELQQHESQDAKAREQFENNRKTKAPFLKGIQVLAQKALAEDKVELKVKLDVDPLPNGKALVPAFMIQPMVKVGNEWKLGGSTRAYTEEWEQAAQVQSPAP